MAEVQVIRTNPETGQQEVGLMSEDQLAADQSGQFEVATPEKLAAYRAANTVTPGEALATTAEGAAQGLTVGLYGAAAGQIAPEYAQGMQERAEKSPLLHGGGEVVGTLAPLLTGVGEAGLAAKAGVTAGKAVAKEAAVAGAEAVGRSAARRAVAGAGKVLEATPAGLLAKGSEKAARALVGGGEGALTSAARTAVQGGIEGAAYSAGSELSESSVNQNYDQLAERLIAAGGEGALLGTAFGGAVGATTNAFGRIIGSRRLAQALSETADKQTLRDLGITSSQLRRMSPERRAAIINDLKRSGAIDEVGRATPEARVRFAEPRIDEAGARIRGAADKVSETSTRDILRDFGISKRQFNKMTQGQRERLFTSLKETGALKNARHLDPEGRLEYAQQRLDTHGPAIGKYVEELDNPRGLLRETDQLELRSKLDDLAGKYERKAGRRVGAPRDEALAAVEDLGIENTKHLPLSQSGREESYRAVRKAYAEGRQNELAPVEVDLFPAEHGGGFERPALRDGRHRLAVAKEHGAERIKANINVFDESGNLVRTLERQDLPIARPSKGHGGTETVGQQAAEAIRREVRRLVDDGLTVENIQQAAKRLRAKDAPAFTDAAKILESKLKRSGGVHVDDAIPLYERLHGIAKDLAEQPGLSSKALGGKIRDEVDHLFAKLKRNADGSVKNDLTYAYLKKAESKFAERGRDAANPLLEASQRAEAQAYNQVANQLRRFTGDALENRLGKNGLEAYRIHKREYEIAKEIQKGAEAQSRDIHFKPRTAEQTTEDVLRELRKMPESELRAKLGASAYDDLRKATDDFELHKLIKAGAEREATAAGGASFGDRVAASSGGGAGAILSSVLSGNPLAAIPGLIAGRVIGAAANRAGEFVAEKSRRVLVDLAQQQALTQARIKHSLSRFLTAGRVSATRIGVDIERVLHVRRDETPEDAYYRIADRLARARAQDPEQRYAGLSDVAPQTAQALIAADQRGLDYLSDYFRQKPSTGNPMLDRAMRHVPPTEDEVHDAALALRTVRQPLAVLTSLKRGTLTLKESDALRAVYPELWNDVRTEAMRQIAGSDTDLPYQDRIRLGLLLDMDLEPSVRPEAIALYQSFYNRPPEQESPRPPQPGQLPIPGKMLQSRVNQIEEGFGEVA